MLPKISIVALFYVRLWGFCSPYITFGEHKSEEKYTEGKGIKMEKKKVRCTFYGLRSVYDADLRERMHEATKTVVEENESIEFLIYLKDGVNLMFLAEAMQLRTAYPEKEIKIVKVAAPDDEHPVNENTMRRLGFLNRYDPDLPLAIFDGLVIADEYSGKAKKDSPGYMMHRVHSIQRWIFTQCDIIFAYDYAAFADSESFELDMLRKNKDKTVIELGSKRTEERIIELAEGLDDKRRDILKRLWDGASYAQIAIKYGVTGTAIKNTASKASREIRESLRRDYLRASRNEKDPEPRACGLLGFEMQSNAYIHDIVLVLSFLGVAFEATDIYVEQDLCFSEIAGAIFPKNALSYREHRLIAVLDPKTVVESDVPVNSYVPPYHSMSFVSDYDVDADISKERMYDHIADHCQFIITDFSSVRDRDALVHICKKNHTRLIDISSFNRRKEPEVQDE